MSPKFISGTNDPMDPINMNLSQSRSQQDTQKSTIFGAPIFNCTYRYFLPLCVILCAVISWLENNSSVLIDDKSKTFSIFQDGATKTQSKCSEDGMPYTNFKISSVFEYCLNFFTIFFILSPLVFIILV